MRDILCHSEGYKAGIATNHADVLHWFPAHGRSMDDFRAAVKAAMEPVKEPEKPTPDPWYAEDQKWAVEAGISDGTRPEEPATRAEIWAMLRNMKGSV